MPADDLPPPPLSKPFWPALPRQFRADQQRYAITVIQYDARFLSLLQKMPDSEIEQLMISLSASSASSSTASSSASSSSSSEKREGDEKPKENRERKSVQEKEDDPQEKRLFLRCSLVMNRLMNRICNACLDKSATEKLLACSSCQMTFYCNETCQKRDWNAHKRWCCRRDAAPDEGPMATAVVKMK